jgi:hypothetical protein
VCSVQMTIRSFVADSENAVPPRRTRSPGLEANCSLGAVHVLISVFPAKGMLKLLLEGRKELRSIFSVHDIMILVFELTNQLRAAANSPGTAC